MLKFAASVTTMFGETELLDRFELAARAGFRAVEIQAPYGESAEALADRAASHNVDVVLINMPVAVGAVPGMGAEFREGFQRSLRYVEALGNPQLHCLAGVTDHPDAEDTFVENLRWAVAEARARNVRLLIEPLNTQDNPGYFLTGSAQGRRIVDRVGAETLRLQYDLYHMQIMEGSLAETIRAQADVIGHIQISGVPGRHEPDAQQEINFPYLFDVIEETGYEGWVGCEYRPRASTFEGLAWAKPYGLPGE
jgi:hydroxypyruvate isomerase